jgi:hypothetical protein
MVAKKTWKVVVLCLLISGCVMWKKVPVTTEPSSPVAVQGNVEIPSSPKEEVPVEVAPDASPELENIKGEALEDYAQKKGVIFAKTNFQGLLATRYVKFLFENQDDPTHRFQLHIGENSDQQTFPWDVKTVKPGYFFVELPVGRYKISSVSIPVGLTMATEEMDVGLEVIPNAICYVGTLKMVGTKERIKLGGLPVIQPGFEYTIEVLDEREEGKAAFQKNYPNFPHDVSIKLMRVVPGGKTN